MGETGEGDTAMQMKEFKVKVLVVPPLLQQRLWGEKERYETRVIKGYTLKDAKKRAGIQ